MLLTIDCLLNINFRESGMEVIDRLVMDTLLGTGAFFVGIGTFMAIDGQNSRIYRASNLLTGYMGNAPCALYGLMNFLWSTVYVWRRATRHKAAALPHVRDRRFRDLLQMRASSVQFHGALNGAVGRKNTTSLHSTQLGRVLVCVCVCYTLVAPSWLTVVARADEVGYRGRGQCHDHSYTVVGLRGTCALLGYIGPDQWVLEKTRRL